MPRYRLADGTPAPGCTTICGQLDKPPLLDWAYNCGVNGTPWRDIRDSAGDKGTSLHDIISGFWLGEEVVVPDGVVGRSFKNFLKWNSQHAIEPVLIEQPFVSEKYRFGGRPDLLAIIDGCLTLPDNKSGKAIYEDYWLQVAGYGILLREHGYETEKWAILRLGKDGSWEYVVRDEVKREEGIFLALLDIYHLRRV